MWTWRHRSETPTRDPTPEGSPPGDGRVTVATAQVSLASGAEHDALLIDYWLTTGAARSAPRHRVGLRPLLRAALRAGRRRAGARSIAARVALRISRRIVHALPPWRAGRAAGQGDAGLGEAAAQPFVRPVRPLPQPGLGEAAQRVAPYTLSPNRYGRHMRCVSRCQNELTFIYKFGPPDKQKPYAYFNI